MSIVKNLKKINTQIGSEVKLVVVVNNQSIRKINQILFLDMKDVAEINVLTAKKKKNLVKYPAKWHFIGLLKKNELQDVVETFDIVQTLNSYKLAKKLNSICVKKNKKMAVLIQVNISGQLNIPGVKKERLCSFIKEISLLKNLSVLGLRYAGPNLSTNLKDTTKNYFKEMSKVFKVIKRKNIPNIKMNYLSMGTSQNYIEAIKYNSNMILLEKSIFDMKNK